MNYYKYDSDFTGKIRQIITYSRLRHMLYYYFGLLLLKLSILGHNLTRFSMKGFYTLDFYGYREIV
jgi:hypothetical protein